MIGVMQLTLMVTERLWLQLMKRQMLIVGLWQEANSGLLYECHVWVTFSTPLLSVLLPKGHIGIGHTSSEVRSDSAVSTFCSSFMLTWRRDMTPFLSHPPPHSFLSLTLLVIFLTSVNLWKFVVQCASFHWAEISKRTVSLKIFSEWKLISRQKNNQEDGRNEAYFPQCRFLSMNKKTNDFRKAVCVFWLVLDPYVQSSISPKVLT